MRQTLLSLRWMVENIRAQRGRVRRSLYWRVYDKEGLHVNSQSSCVKRPLAVAISMHTMLMFPILTIHDTFKGVLSCNLITRVRLELVAFCH